MLKDRGKNFKRFDKDRDGNFPQHGNPSPFMNDFPNVNRDLSHLPGDLNIDELTQGLLEFTDCKNALQGPTLVIIYHTASQSTFPFL